MKKDVNSMSTQEKSESVMSDYNDIASEYCDEFCDTQVYNDFIDKWLQTIQKGNILDVGCGGGNNCQYINEKEGFQAYGIDFSDGMIAEARKRYPNVKIKKMDMTNITFPDQTFDGILSNCSLIHIPTELLSQTLQGFKRILKPNGKLLLIVLDGKGEEMVEEPYREGQDVYAYTKYFTTEEISKLLNDNGFKVDGIEKRKTESENELAGGELVIYASNERIQELKKGNSPANQRELG